MKWMLVLLAVATLVFAAGVRAGEMTPLQADRLAYSERMFKLDLTEDPEGVVIRNGSFYDFEQKSWEYCAMKRVLGVGKDYYQFYLATGYATSGKIVGSVSYDLTPLIGNIFGLPIYNVLSLDVGYYGGYDMIEAKIAHGVGATMIKVDAVALAQTLGVSLF